MVEEGGDAVLVVEAVAELDEEIEERPRTQRLLVIVDKVQLAGMDGTSDAKREKQIVRGLDLPARCQRCLRPS